MKMLAWLFGEGKLSLLDSIESSGDSLTLTQDLCTISQRLGIINEGNSLESCQYLISIFERKKKYEIVIDLISKLIGNSFLGP